MSDDVQPDAPEPRLRDATQRAPIVTPADAPDARPLLGESQLATLRRYGDESEIARGDLLFAEGDQGYDLIVLLEGNIDIR